jgi:hypothetical protein
VDLLPEYEKLSCHQKDKTKSPHKDKPSNNRRFKHSQPYTRKLWINPITAEDRRPYPKAYHSKNSRPQTIGTPDSR